MELHVNKIVYVYITGIPENKTGFANHKFINPWNGIFPKNRKNWTPQK